MYPPGINTLKKVKVRDNKLREDKDVRGPASIRLQYRQDGNKGKKILAGEDAPSLISKLSGLYHMLL